MIHLSSSQPSSCSFVHFVVKVFAVLVGQNNLLAKYLPCQGAGPTSGHSYSPKTLSAASAPDWMQSGIPIPL